MSNKNPTSGGSQSQPSGGAQTGGAQGQPASQSPQPTPQGLMGMAQVPPSGTEYKRSLPPLGQGPNGANGDALDRLGRASDAPSPSDLPERSMGRLHRRPDRTGTNQAVWGKCGIALSGLHPIHLGNPSGSRLRPSYRGHSSLSSSVLHRNPLHQIPRHLLLPPVVKAGGSGIGMPGQVLDVFQRRPLV
jgi:hypothetical protein